MTGVAAERQTLRGHEASQHALFFPVSRDLDQLHREDQGRPARNDTAGSCITTAKECAR
eukprot:COSAG05_NODE_205_length_14184_cov_81.700887_2_plen_59_part_00